MLEAQLREKWLARERSVPIHTAMKFAPEGLVLGAGTVLIGAIEHRRLNTLEGQEPIVLALLCAAYGKAVPLKVLGNIERAINSWNAGDDCLAYIHLAHAGLPVLDDPYAAACRLFVADSVMKAGVSPRSIFQALRFDTSHTGAVTKLYNPTEPRVPAGSGRKSGQWTRLLSWIGELDAGQLAELGAYASRVLGPAGAAVATFGLLFVPSPNKIRVEGEVAALPGLRYAWNRDETLLRLTYDDSNSERHTYSAQLDGDVFRDAQGRVIGRLLSGSTVAIDVAAVSPDLVNDDEPRMCPAPGPDRASNDLGRAYENYVKSIVNPYPRTTPSGSAFSSRTLRIPESLSTMMIASTTQARWSMRRARVMLNSSRSR